MRKKISIIIVSLVIATMFHGFKVQANSGDWDFLKLNNCVGYSKLVTQTKRFTFHFSKDEVDTVHTENGVIYSLPGCNRTTAPEKPTFPIWKQTYPLQKSSHISYIKTIKVDGYKIDDSNTPIITPLAPMKYSMVNHVEGESTYSDTIRNGASDNQSRDSIVPSDVKDIYPQVNVAGKISTYDHETKLSLSVYPMYVLDGCVYLVTKMTIEVGFQDTKEPSNPDTKDNSSIILAPDEFKDVAEKLASIQEKEGFETEVVLLSSVEKLEEADFPKPLTDGYSKGDAYGFIERYNYSLSAKIRNMLETRLQNDKVDYLTILGDASWIPPSFYFYVHVRSLVDSCVPTDFYYMAPFAAYRTMDFEISVGRIPVQTRNDAINAVNKIEQYLTVLENSEEDWKTTISMFSGDPFRGDYFGELSQCNVINKDILNGLTINKYFQTSDEFTSEQCKDVLYGDNNRLLWITGHGSGDELYFSKDSVSAEDVLRAPKKAKLPIIVSESCLNGTWDSRLINGEENTPLLSFAESIFRSEGAGIAYIGGSRSNYSHIEIEYDNGRPELIDLTYINSVIEYTLDYSIHSPERTLGDSVKKALFTYYSSDLQTNKKGHFDTPDAKALFGYCLLGDPTLPCIEKEQATKYEVPVIQKPGGVYKSPDYFPIISIDDGVDMNVKSDSTTLQYLYCSYDKNNKQLLASGTINEPSSKVFSKTFTDLVKFTGCIRFETDDYKENRIVCHSKYRSDLRIEKTNGIQLLRIDEQVGHSVRVFNDGIFETGNFKISVLKNGEMETETVFRNLPFDSYMSYDFYTESSKAEDFQVEIVIDLLGKKEEHLVDNRLLYDFCVEEEPFCRVGLLTSPDYRTDIGENYLHFNELREFFKEEGNNLQLHTVSYYFDENGTVSYDLLGFDALILFDEIWHDEPIVLKKALQKFVNQGGKILGVCAADSNPWDGLNWSEQMQPFFGIKPELPIHIFRPSDKKADFKLIEKPTGFEKETYQVHSMFNLCPHIEEEWVDWNEDHLLPHAKYIASSDQLGLNYIQCGSNIFLYTGMLQSYSFEECPDTYLLFRDLIQSMFEVSNNIGIDLVKRVDDKVLYAKDTTPVQITVANHGNETVSHAILECNGTEICVIENLIGKSTRVIPFDVTVEDVGKNEYTFTLHSSDDSNKSGDSTAGIDSEDMYAEDNAYVFICNASAGPANSATRGTETFVPMNEDETQPENSEIFCYENQLNLHILDFKNTEQGLYVATPTGIHVYKDSKKVETIPYKKEWHAQYPDIFDSFQLNHESSSYDIRKANKSFLEVDDFCIVICLQTVIHVLDRKTHNLLYSVNGTDYKQKLVLDKKFEEVLDVCIVGDYIYVDTGMGHIVLDKYTGTCIGKSYWKIGFTVIGEYLVGTYCSNIVLYNMNNHQWSFIDVEAKYNFTELYRKDDETITLFQSEYRYYVEIPIQDLFVENTLIIPDSQVRKTDGLKSVIQIQEGETPLVLQDTFMKLKCRSKLLCVELCTFDDSSYSVGENYFGVDMNEASNKESLAPLGNYAYKVPGVDLYVLDYTKYELLVRDMESGSVHKFNKKWDKGYYCTEKRITEYEKGHYLKIVEYEDEMCCFRYDFKDYLQEGSFSPHISPLVIEDVKKKITEISMCQDYYCVYETGEQSVIFMDKEDGSIQHQYQFFPDDTLPFSDNMDVPEMYSCGNTVYLLDTSNKCIYPCNSANGFTEPILLQSVFLDTHFCNLIVDEETIYLLHYPTSRIAVLEDGVLTEWINPETLDAKMIRSFDICDGEIIINDFFTGGVFTQPF